jgi:hypothetical protein
MPLNPIAASLLLYFEVPYSKLLELNEKYPNFLLESLSKFGYSTLHLLPTDSRDAFEEFNSWPKEGRDQTYFKMTQRRKVVPVKIIENSSEFNLEKGVVSVIKFESVEDFIKDSERLSRTDDCCFTVLYVVNEVPTDSISKEFKALINRQLSLHLIPSALINCPSPDYSRFAISFSKGSEGEFRRRPIESPGSGLFDVKGWRGFAGGITQLYSLKAELSYVLGITGKYGD